MGSTIEVILTIIGLSFWLLFPIGMFLSVSHIDKAGDKREKVYRPIPFNRHHPFHFFRQWLKH